jgi:capsular polysaccharide transport system permease protein
MTANPLKVLQRIGRWVRNRKLFIAVVVLPVALGIVYFGFIAPDIFVSESHFVVRNQTRQSTSGLGSLLQSTGISATGDADMYSVQDYLTSRDALVRLDAEYHVNAGFSRAAIAGLDRFTTFSPDRSFEGLLRYYRRHIVETDFDTSSSILTLTVRAGTAPEAFRLNTALLKLSEEFVNKMNERSRTDLLKFSLADVADAEHEAVRASQAVSNYRNGTAVYDPAKQSELNLTRVGLLQQDLISMQGQLADVRSVAANNPQIPVIKNRIAVLEQAIAAETAKVAGGEGSLSSKTADYDGIVIYRDLSVKRLELAQISLQSAREDALKQQIYLERVNEPNLPDEAIEPKRLRNVGLVILVSMMLFGLLSLVNASVRDHVT